MSKVPLIEDLYRSLDSILSFLTHSRAVFLLMNALIAFFLTIVALMLIGHRKGNHSTNRLKPLMLTILTLLTFSAALSLYLLGLIKANLSFYTPLEYVFGYILYCVYILLLMLKSNYEKDTPYISKRSYSCIYLTYLISVSVVVQRIFQVRLSVVISEDSLDILKLSIDGHLEHSFHAVHYDVAPLHTYLHVIIAHVFGLEPLASLPDSLIGLSLGLSFLMYMHMLMKSSLESNSCNNMWLLALLPALLMIHPYSFGGSLTSYVNSVSLGPSLLLLAFILVKLISHKAIMSRGNFILATIFISSSVLMHPIGFTTVIISMIALLIPQILNVNVNSSIRKYLYNGLIFATILFIVRVAYTGLVYGLTGFLSDISEALFTRLHSLPGEITPRTYVYLPVSSLYSYSFILGTLAAILLYNLKDFVQRKSEWIAQFNIIIIAIILTSSLFSYYVVSAGISSKYILGNTMSLISICILLEYVKFLKRYTQRLLGLTLFTSMILISSFGTLTSPLVMLSHYRISQGASPASDMDYIAASQIALLFSDSDGSYTIVYDDRWPYSTPLAIYVALKARQLLKNDVLTLPRVNVEYSTELEVNNNIAYSGWKILLTFK